MSPEQARKITALALAQNADPRDAAEVLGQALSGLHAEAQVLLNFIETANGHQADHDGSTVCAYAHVHRIEALELLFTYHMGASWNAPPAATESEAAGG